MNKLIQILKDKWWLFVLIFIFLYSYYVRSFNIVPDKLLSFDPIFQYRFTKYFADWGVIPIWDELTYYVGRPADFTLTLPLMYYITSIFYWFLKDFGFSLMTTASYMSAIYGALIVFPAFLLGNELSNKYGGLLSAILIGTAPQILVRTFGSSYDTDQLVLFFLFLTLYLGLYALKRKTISSFCLALLGFSAFMLMWSNFTYTFLILIAFVIFYFVLNFVYEFKNNRKLFESIKIGFSKIKMQIVILIFLLIGLFIIGYLNNVNVLVSFYTLIGFAQKAEQWIVNVSIAELQPFNILSLEGWITATGRFYTQDMIINSIILLFFISMLILGIFKALKKDLFTLSFLIVLLIIAFYTSTRGIRFTEFTSGLFIVLIGSGFGILLESIENDIMLKSILLGFAIFVALSAMSISAELGKQLGPDINPNWDNAWEFLRSQTPEFSIIGTWWDPGHMITGLAERRAYADGAHCQIGSDFKNACFYTINDRITDLGKIMVTSDENESLKLIRKYQGNSPKVYWIASDDLIGKFQWLQYFGIGCDARVENRCPLYIQIPEQSRSVDANGNIILRNYGNIVVFQGLSVPIPIFIQGINGALFDEIIYYSNGEVNTFKMNESEKQVLIQTLKPLEKQLSFRFTNQSIDLTVWVPQHYAYIVIIPKNLRESVFTKMFMLEGQGLEHFKQVFRNEQVKIYEVI
ncbi:MAG: STT3 domain-containing protein [Candidatus Aenigmatarchaeota archaeon]